VEYSLLSEDCVTLFVADGFKGLTILDISNVMKPVILSQLASGGWGFRLTVLQKEQLLLLC
jgi:hypothetical protein